MLLLTVVLLILLVLLSYVIFDRDVLAPPTVVSLGLFFSALCAYHNEEVWSLRFSGLTTWVIFIGVLSFIFGGMLAILLVNRKHLNKVGFSHNVYTISPLEIEYSKTLLFIALQLLTLFLLYTELRNITGYSSWIDIVTTFRSQTATVSPEKYTMRFSRLLSLCLRFSFSTALVYSYVVGNNISIHKKQNFLNWIPILLSCLFAIMQGYRSDMLRFWLAIIVVAYTLKKRSVGWRSSREIRMMLKRMAFSVLFIAVIFVSLRGIVGRNTDKDFLYHLTFYAGSPVAAFDLFIKEPLPPSDIFGKETFYQLNQGLAVWLGILKQRYFFYKEFRMTPSGIYIGNVYTALRPPYYDFGFVGMIIVMIIMGLFFTFFYCKVRDQYGKHPIDFRLLLYSYVAYTFFMYFYNCYNHFISMGFIRLVIELLIVRWFLVDFHLPRCKMKLLIPRCKMKLQ